MSQQQALSLQRSGTGVATAEHVQWATMFCLINGCHIDLAERLTEL